MKKSELKQIIKEEYNNILKEAPGTKSLDKKLVVTGIANWLSDVVNDKTTGLLNFFRTGGNYMKTIPVIGVSKASLLTKDSVEFWINPKDLNLKMSRIKITIEVLQ